MVLQVQGGLPGVHPGEGAAQPAGPPRRAPAQAAEAAVGQPQGGASGGGLGGWTRGMASCVRCTEGCLCGLRRGGAASASASASRTPPAPVPEPAHVCPICTAHPYRRSWCAGCPASSTTSTATTSSATTCTRSTMWGCWCSGVSRVHPGVGRRDALPAGVHVWAAAACCFMPPPPPPPRNPAHSTPPATPAPHLPPTCRPCVCRDQARLPGRHAEARGGGAGGGADRPQPAEERAGHLPRGAGLCVGVCVRLCMCAWFVAVCHCVCVCVLRVLLGVEAAGTTHRGNAAGDAAAVPDFAQPGPSPLLPRLPSSHPAAAPHPLPLPSPRRRRWAWG